MNNIFDQIIVWIEGHEHTVELVKWFAVGLIGWALGVFRVLRDWGSQPMISINPVYSHCFYETHSKFGPHTDAALVTFILDIELSNPTNHPIAVRNFELKIKKKRFFRKWTTPAQAIGFPSMPRTSMPGGQEKVIPLWLTTFEEYGDQLCIKKVESYDSSAGLVFFSIAITEQDLLQLQDCFTVLVNAKFVTGTATTISPIRVKTDINLLERMIPGSSCYVRHPSVPTLVN